METEKQAILKKKFSSFINTIQPSDRLAIIHHRDPDGICSAVLTAKAVSRVSNVDALTVIDSDYFDLGKIISKLKTQGINKAIFVDLGVDNQPELINDFADYADILILDHHKVYDNFTSDKILLLKSQFFSELDGSKYPATKLCFDLFSELTNLKDLEWITLIGVQGDMGYKSWKDFFHEIFDRTGLTLEQINEGVELINSVETIFPKRFQELFKQLMTSNSIKEFLESPLKEFREQFQKEINQYVNDFSEKAVFYEKLSLYIYEINPEHNIKSALINKISTKYPNNTIIIIEDLGWEKLIFSGRRQDFKVKMNQLLEDSINGIKNSSAGGHIPAAAGSIPKKELGVFKKQLIKAAEKQLI